MSPHSLSLYSSSSLFASSLSLSLNQQPENAVPSTPVRRFIFFLLPYRSFGQRHAAADRADGGGERGSRIQREHVLHVPRCQEALLWNGSEPNCVRARRGPEREGDREGLDKADGKRLLPRPRRLHRRETHWLPG